MGQRLSTVGLPRRGEHRSTVSGAAAWGDGGRRRGAAVAECEGVTVGEPSG
jgi:hypothetical protein